MSFALEQILSMWVVQERSDTIIRPGYIAITGISYWIILPEVFPLLRLIALFTF